MVQPRSKVIVIIAASAKNRVIGNKGTIPWHVPADFAHFKSSTVGQTLLMGRTTFESIGRPLPNRTTIVLTRDAGWRYPGVEVAHDLQGGLNLAEEFPGDLVVAGGSHIYAEMLPHAKLQVLSEIDDEPEGDAYYPHWDPHEWLAEKPESREGFTLTRWHRKTVRVRDFEFELSPSAAATWWTTDWSARLSRAIRDQKNHSPDPSLVNWNCVHHAAMRVIIEAAEEQLHPVPIRTEPSRSDRRIVRLGEHISMQDVKEVQGALFHWSDYVAPRRSLA